MVNEKNIFTDFWSFSWVRMIKLEFLWWGKIKIAIKFVLHFSYAYYFVFILFCRMTRHSFPLWVIITVNYHKYIYYISFCHVGLFIHVTYCRQSTSFNAKLPWTWQYRTIIFGSKKMCPFLRISNYELHNMIKCHSFLRIIVMFCFKVVLKCM